MASAHRASRAPRARCQVHFFQQIAVPAALIISSSARAHPEEQINLTPFTDTRGNLTRYHGTVSDVVLFEDAHWADPTTLEFLELLIDRSRHLPLLLVLTHRPEFQPTWTRHGHVAALALSRLSRAQSAQAILKVAGDKALPTELVEQLVTKANGVPLYLEELIKTVIESGQVELAGDRYLAAAHVGTITVPASLRDSLTARFDRVPDVKALAQIGAAIGRELLLVGHFTGMAAKSFCGDWIGARAHAAEIDRLYDPTRDQALIPVLLTDFKQGAALYAMYWTWVLGYPDQAVPIHDAMVANTRVLKHPFSLGFALTFGALGFYSRGDASVLEAKADEAIALGREYRLPFYADALGPIMKGLANLLAGHNETGIGLLEKGMAVWRAIGANFLLPALNGALAEAYAARYCLAGAT